MIEVRPTAAALPPKPVQASPSAIENNATGDGKKLPKSGEVSTQIEQVNATSKQSEEKADELKNSIASMNEYVQSVQRDLQFTVDEELETTVIKVVDGRSGELIRQIPEEVFLDLARKLNDQGEFSLVNATG